MFASPFHNCYSASYVCFFQFRFSSSNYLSIYYTLLNMFLPLSVSSPLIFPLLCLSISYVYNLPFLILQSHRFILSLLFFNHFHSQPPFLRKSYARNIVFLTFSLNVHILHLDRYFVGYCSKVCLIARSHHVIFIIHFVCTIAVNAPTSAAALIQKHFNFLRCLFQNLMKKELKNVSEVIHWKNCAKRC